MAQQDRTHAQTSAYSTAGMTERSLASCVERTCRLLNVPYFHPFRSDHSAPGWPDYVLLIPEGAGFRLHTVELKTERGQLRPSQVVWKERLEATHGVRYALWRPSDWHSGEVERVLRGYEEA